MEILLWAYTCKQQPTCKFFNKSERILWKLWKKSYRLKLLSKAIIPCFSKKWVWPLSKNGAKRSCIT